jgi:hypothetical protein
LSSELELHKNTWSSLAGAQNLTLSELLLLHKQHFEVCVVVVDPHMHTWREELLLLLLLLVQEARALDKNNIFVAKTTEASKARARMIYITLLYKNWQQSHQISTEQEL